jgi:hypothetical protein
MNERVSAEANTSGLLTEAHWQKSSYSNGQANCVEVATNLPGLVVVRDSKDPNGGVLRVNREGWCAFLQRLRMIGASGNSQTARGYSATVPE